MSIRAEHDTLDMSLLFPYVQYTVHESLQLVHFTLFCSLLFIPPPSTSNLSTGPIAIFVHLFPFYILPAHKSVHSRTSHDAPVANYQLPESTSPLTPVWGFNGKPPERSCSKYTFYTQHVVGLSVSGGCRGVHSGNRLT